MTYLNRLGGSSFNEYSLNDLPKLEITSKLINPFERSDNNSSVLYTARNSKSTSTQVSGNYLYNNVINNDRNNYDNTNNIVIKPLELYNGIGGFKSLQ